MAGGKLVVVGAVAAGMSAASQAKRRRPEIEVEVFEQGRWVSYGACGMPYNIQDPARPIDDLVVITPERFLAERQIRVNTNHRVEEVDTAAGRVRVNDGKSSRWVGYDWLVLATGCSPQVPDVEGKDLSGVFVLHNLDHAAAIKDFLARHDPRRAVVVGGGHIGLEMAEVLTTRGLEVTVIKRSEAMPPGQPGEVTSMVRAELDKYGVRVVTGARLDGLEGRGRVERVVTDQGKLDADFVLIATGVKPNVELAEAAGIRLGGSGAIEVDEHQATSAERVWAAGDCSEAFHRLLGKGMFIPRGTTANKQGRVAGANVAGAKARFAGVLGTSVTKVFGLAVGNTGIDERQAASLGIEAAAVAVTTATRAHAYPGASRIMVRLVFDRASGRVLGAQICGGEGVAKRLDVVAAAIQAGWDVEELAGLDASYAPPFAPVWDPVLVAANQARKVAGGR